MRKLAIAVPLLAVLISGCSDEKKERGLEVLPDMFHTPAHKAYTAHESADGKTQYATSLPPVEGTVPRSGPEYTLAANDFAGAKKLANPLTPTAEVLRSGAHWYTITCATCHGRDGDPGKTEISKHFSGIPKINGANVLAYSEGELYHIITVGRNRMPHLRNQLPSAERWAVATYLKVLARATAAATDASELVSDAEGEIRQHPEDAGAQAKMQQGKTVLAQREADLKAILALGDHRDHLADQFKLLPEPRPEYLPPSWNEPGGSNGSHAGPSGHSGGHQ
jgi:mono/diheme cytochrome c family protein